MLGHKTTFQRCSGILWGLSPANGGNHCDTFSSGSKDLGCISSSDASNTYSRNMFLAAQGGKSIRSYNWVAVFFGLGGKDRPDTQVVYRQGNGFLQFCRSIYG